MSSNFQLGVEDNRTSDCERGGFLGTKEGIPWVRTVRIGKSTDSSRFQSRALFAGLGQSEGAPRLWFAVLAQAFRDYYGDIPSEGPSRYRQVQVNYCQRNARAWFLSDSDRDGDFRWIAELFDLDTRAVRRRLFSGARIVLGEIFGGAGAEPGGR